MIFLGLLVVLNIAGLIFYDFFIPLSVALIPVVGAMDYFYWNKKARKVNEIIILTSLRSFIPYYVFFYSGNFDLNPGTLGYDFYLVLTFGVASFNILWLQQAFGSRFGLKLRCKLFDFRKEFEPEKMFL